MAVCAAKSRTMAQIESRIATGSEAFRGAVYAVAAGAADIALAATA